MTCSRVDTTALQLLLLAVAAVALLTYLLQAWLRRPAAMRTANAHRIERETAGLQTAVAKCGWVPPLRPPAPVPAAAAASAPAPAVPTVTHLQEPLPPSVRAAVAAAARSTAKRDFSRHQRPRANPYTSTHPRQRAVWAIEYQATWQDCLEAAERTRGLTARDLRRED